MLYYRTIHTLQQIKLPNHKPRKSTFPTMKNFEINWREQRIRLLKLCRSRENVMGLLLYICVIIYVCISVYETLSRR